MGIVTKIGDKGTTKMLSGETVSKCDQRLMALGTLDELVSSLGLARSLADQKELAAEIYALQENLFKLGAELSSYKLELTDQAALELEEKILTLENKIDLADTFTVPGKNSCSASLDLARAMARRMEREVVYLKEKGFIKNEHLLIYCNRLSDYLFLLARQA